VLSSNLLIHKQLAATRDELLKGLKARGRCAELSEVEPRKNGLELRCLGLERVIEELMSAIEILKGQPPNLDTKSEGSAEFIGMPEDSDLKGLAIHIEDCGENTVPEENRLNPIDKYTTTLRRRVIPYRVRAVILYILSQLRQNDLIEQVLGIGSESARNRHCSFWHISMGTPDVNGERTKIRG
jgi:hypothetical protein